MIQEIIGGESLDDKTVRAWVRVDVEGLADLGLMEGLVRVTDPFAVLIPGQWRMYSGGEVMVVEFVALVTDWIAEAKLKRGWASPDWGKA